MRNIDTGDVPALLVMDVQRSIADRVPDKAAYLGRLQEVIEAARDAAIPVLYIAVQFRDGYPEASPRNKAFSQIKGTGRLLQSDPDSAIEDAVAPQGDEPVITKKRVSAFAGSDLDVILRAGGINYLILTGIATSGVVLSTLRAAADMDFRLTVIADCCADGDEEVHRILTEKVFPRQAEVVTAEEWKQSLAT